MTATGRSLRSSEFCIPNSELRDPRCDCRIPDAKIYRHFLGLCCQDLQMQRFVDFHISRFKNF